MFKTLNSLYLNICLGDVGDGTNKTNSSLTNPGILFSLVFNLMQEQLGSLVQGR